MIKNMQKLCGGLETHSANGFLAPFKIGGAV